MIAKTDASDAIEQAALADLHAAATPELVETLGLQAKRFGSTFASRAAALPASAIVINRALGIGLDQAATQHELQDIVEDYCNAGVARYFLQCHPHAEPPGIPDWLAELGLTKARGWQKFERGPSPAPVMDCNLRISEVGPEQGANFARIVCDAFDLGDVAQPWLSRLPGRRGWHVFMSFDGEEPAGTGALFVRDGVAWSDFGATAPEFRRRGSQSALLARRIDHAIALGCERVFTCTGEDVAGDPQHSFRNILKMGFEMTYVRSNYAPPY